ncbi:CDP-alcohol phosphatidyltransferase family protein [Pseudomonas luteola]
MPSVYDLKPRFQQLLRPCVTALYKKGITANQVTLSACLGSIVIGVAVSLLASFSLVFLLVPVWMLLRMALNAIDGILAREYAQQSRLGAYLNEVCDLVSDVALYLPFMLLATCPWLVLVVTFLAWLSEYVGVMGLMVGADRRYDGPMGKSDRALVFGGMGLLVALGVSPGLWLDVALAIMAGLACLTIYNRINKGMNAAV